LEHWRFIPEGHDPSGFWSVHTTRSAALFVPTFSPGEEVADEHPSTIKTAAHGAPRKVRAFMASAGSTGRSTVAGYG
jgi:hypothetical protein